MSYFILIYIKMLFLNAFCLYEILVPNLKYTDTKKITMRYRLFMSKIKVCIGEANTNSRTCT
jgi:hypothetical protein